MNLIKDHNKSRDEHVVDMGEHGDNEGVLPEHHVRGRVLAVDLHHGQTPNKIAEYLQSSICTEKITSQPSKNLIFALT